MKRKIVIIFTMLACVLMYACSKSNENAALHPKEISSKSKIDELALKLSTDSEFIAMAKLTKEEITAYSNKLKENIKSGKSEKLSFTASPGFIHRMAQLQGSLTSKFPALSQLSKAERQQVFKLSSIAAADKRKNNAPKISSCEDACDEEYGGLMTDLEDYLNGELYDIRWRWSQCAGACPYPGELGYDSYMPRPSGGCVNSYNADIGDLNAYVSYWQNEYLLSWYDCYTYCGS